MAEKVKIEIPVAIDEKGFASWNGKSWERKETNIENAINKCRARHVNDVAQDRVIVVEIEVDLEEFFTNPIIQK